MAGGARFEAGQPGAQRHVRWGLQERIGPDQRGGDEPSQGAANARPRRLQVTSGLSAGGASPGAGRL